MRKLFFPDVLSRLLAWVVVPKRTKLNLCQRGQGEEPMPVVIVQKNYNVSPIVVNVLLY